jgi:hypothetical protein
MRPSASAGKLNFALSLIRGRRNLTPVPRSEFAPQNASIRDRQNPAGDRVLLGPESRESVPARAVFRDYSSSLDVGFFALTPDNGIIKIASPW